MVEGKGQKIRSFFRNFRLSKREVVIMSFILVAIYLVFAGIVYYFFANPVYGVEVIPVYYNVTSFCSLSMCDCKCYETSNLPEIKGNKLCASDCNAYYGIVGCQMQDKDCIPVFSFEPEQ